MRIQRRSRNNLKLKRLRRSQLRLLLHLAHQMKMTGSKKKQRINALRKRNV
jgi:hypothetical protein